MKAAGKRQKAEGREQRTSIAGETPPSAFIPQPSSFPLVGIIMGSTSDWPTMREAARGLAAAGVPFEARVVSAHRTPELLYDYAGSAEARGLRCLIAGAGGAAHLPGMAAAMTILPVLGVPVRSRALGGLDSLLSIVQMPAGVPVAAFRVGPEGAADAARFAVALLRAAGVFQAETGRSEVGPAAK